MKLRFIKFCVSLLLLLGFSTAFAQVESEAPSEDLGYYITSAGEKSRVAGLLHVYVTPIRKFYTSSRTSRFELKVNLYTKFKFDGEFGKTSTILQTREEERLVFSGNDIAMTTVDCNSEEECSYIITSHLPLTNSEYETIMEQGIGQVIFVVDAYKRRMVRVSKKGSNRIQKAMNSIYLANAPGDISAN